VSEYTELARSYTLVMALGVLVSHLYLTALTGGRRRDLAAYAAGLVLLGTAHLFALLILLPHAALLYGRDRALVRRWAVAVAAALLAEVPLIRLAAGQSKAIGWVRPPNLTDLGDLVAGLTGSGWTALPVVVLVALGLIGGGAAGARRYLAAWAFLPPLALVIASYAEPVYVFRYLLFCVPAWALLTAFGLDRLAASRWNLLPLAAAGALLVGLSIPQQLSIRREDSRQDDLRRLAHIIAAHRAPGDAVAYCRTAYRHISVAYPAVFGSLRDISLGGGPARAGSLNGHDVSAPILSGRLATVRRVWYIQTSGCPAARNRPEVARYDLIARSPAFRPAGFWVYKGGQVYLFDRAG
jgi:mannosyltransferase